ncbi:MAG: tetratricopeptide repeat protein [Gammaproteobacteria bacterium]|nr:tetratricopeptide repeat protein [Gammaproteobacteria bacterium]
METEEEQVERLKAWLKENGLSIVFGIVIGVGGIGGYNYWRHVQETTAAEASSHYTQMIEALSADDDVSLQLHADILADKYSSTEYALMAHLALARMHVDSGDFAAAETALQQIVGSAAQEPLAYLARTRLAAVLVQTEQYEQALSTLAIEFPDEFAALVDELRGDVLARQGKAGEAITAYRKAQLAEPGPADPEFLRRKLDDLGSRS